MIKSTQKPRPSQVSKPCLSHHKQRPCQIPTLGDITHLSGTSRGTLVSPACAAALALLLAVIVTSALRCPAHLTRRGEEDHVYDCGLLTVPSNRPQSQPLVMGEAGQHILEVTFQKTSVLSLLRSKCADTLQTGHMCFKMHAAGKPPQTDTDSALKTTKKTFVLQLIPMRILEQMNKYLL